MDTEILLIGASGHAKIIIDCLASQNIKVKAIFDDNPELKILNDISVIGSYDNKRYTNIPLLISIGNNKIRKHFADICKHHFCNAIHSSVILASTAKVDVGAVLIHGCIIQSEAIIGKHCIINTGSTIDHECRLEDFVHISPNATLCGNVQVGEGTHIGAGATVIQGVKIGKWATIGAGSIVINDIPDFATAVGCPARIVKFNHH